MSRILFFLFGVVICLNATRGDDTSTAETSDPSNVPTVAGGVNAKAFKSLAPAKGYLIGLELGFEKSGSEEVIKAVRPIYRAGDKELLGMQHGAHPANPTIIKAKVGYVVGAINYKCGINFDGCSLLFMKFEGGELHTTDCYESDWVGYIGKKTTYTIGGNGAPAVGIAGRGSAKELNGLGLVFLGQEEFSLNSISGKVVEGQIDNGRMAPRILGQAINPEFKDIAPEGGLLIGFEIGFGVRFNREMIRTARPIYLVGEKEILGDQHGTQPQNPVKLKARSGYAVGAIAVRHGLGFDGMSITFMKVVDGKLDPKDSYESEYVGTNEKKPTTKLGGSGTPVIGIIGRSNIKDMTGMGLLFKGEEGYEPMKRP